MEERFRNLDYQNWKPVRTLGTDSYGTVYEIARDDGFGMVDHAASENFLPRFLTAKWWIPEFILSVFRQH